MDVPRPAAQQELVRNYYQGDTPYLAILDKSGRAVYSATDKVISVDAASGILDNALK